jgi:hypothetical protein
MRLKVPHVSSRVSLGYLGLSLRNPVGRGVVMSLKGSLVLVVALFVSFSATAFGRIGETGAQCTKRYGKSIKVQKEDQTVLFMKKGFVVAAHFHDGKVDAIFYQKAEKNILDIAVEMSDNEVSNFLKANADGREWNEKEVLSLDQNWITSDGELLAAVYSGQNILAILTREYTERAAAATKAEEDDALSDF